MQLCEEAAVHDAADPEEVMRDVIGARGEDIPLAMRIVHITYDMEAIVRLLSSGSILSIGTRRAFMNRPMRKRGP